MAKCIPLYVHGKDYRYFNRACNFWMPWQEAIAARGLFACAKQTGSERYWKFTDSVISNCLAYGWWKDGSDWHVGAAIRYDDDLPLEPWCYQDTGYVIDERGTDFINWAWPMVALGVERMQGPLQEKAIEIDQWIRGRRSGATGFDRAGEWAYTPTPFTLIE